MLTALFVMAVSSVVVVGILDTEVLQFSALRNTIDYDRARYLAEAGIAHALAELEQDILWRDGFGDTEFPIGSGSTYSVSVQDGPSSTIIVTATGISGSITRRLQVTTRYGG